MSLLAQVFDPANFSAFLTQLQADLQTPTFWLAVGKIIWINVLLSGDNALVIAMACRGLHGRNRLWGMVIGAGIAVILLIAFTGIIATLMVLPYLKLVGGIALLFIAAYLALGSLLPLLTRNLALALSLSGLIASPAFGYAGVGFPIADMNGFARFWGDCLPLRWYISILFDQAARGLPTSGSAPALLLLGFIALVFGALAWLRLRGLRWPARMSAPAPARFQ